MYFKNDYNMQLSASRSDERIIGKVGLRAGLVAILLILGVFGFIVLLSTGYRVWAVICGTVATALIALIIVDPLKVFKKKPEDMSDNR